MSSYVYLLHHKSEARFKIGKANDVLNRVCQLHRSDFDFLKSRALKTLSEQSARLLERVLHHMFSEFRLTPSSKTTPRFPLLRRGEDGATEWFELVCWDRVCRFLEENRDLLKVEEVPCEMLEQIAGTFDEKFRKAEQIREKAHLRMVKRELATFSAYQSRREDVANDLADSLHRLRSLCPYLVVVANLGQLLLVGTAPKKFARSAVKISSDLDDQLSKISSHLPFKEASRYANDKQGNAHFAIVLPGEPGVGAATQSCHRHWADEDNALLWSATPGIPGFDLEVCSTEISQAIGVLGMLQEGYLPPVLQALAA